MNKTELLSELFDINKAIQEHNQSSLFVPDNTFEDDYAMMELYSELLEEKVAILEQLV